MERQTDILYVKNVIKPLEDLVRRIESSEELSSEGLKQLNQLLLEKYLILERILQDNCLDHQ